MLLTHSKSMKEGLLSTRLHLFFSANLTFRIDTRATVRCSVKHSPTQASHVLTACLLLGAYYNLSTHQLLYMYNLTEVSVSVIPIIQTRIYRLRQVRNLSNVIYWGSLGIGHQTDRQKKYLISQIERRIIIKDIRSQEKKFRETKRICPKI